MKKSNRLILVVAMSVMTLLAYAQEKKLATEPSTTQPKSENVQPNNNKPQDPTQKISLYQQPDEKSPVVGTIEPHQAIIPIFSQGEWTKVADPSNGNVGWISNDTLKKQGLPVVKTVIQTINSANEEGYKMMQYLSSDTRMEEMMQKWQAQRQNMQNLFNQMLQENAKTLNMLSQELQNPNFPFVMVVQDKNAKSTNTDTNATPK